MQLGLELLAPGRCSFTTYAWDWGDEEASGWGDKKLWVGVLKKLWVGVRVRLLRE